MINPPNKPGPKKSSLVHTLLSHYYSIGTKQPKKPLQFSKLATQTALSGFDPVRKNLSRLAITFAMVDNTAGPKETDSQPARLSKPTPRKTLPPQRKQVKKSQIILSAGLSGLAALAITSLLAVSLPLQIIIVSLAIVVGGAARFALSKNNTKTLAKRVAKPTTPAKTSPEKEIPNRIKQWRQLATREPENKGFFTRNIIKEIRSQLKKSLGELGVTDFDLFGYGKDKEAIIFRLWETERLPDETIQEINRAIDANKDWPEIQQIALQEWEKNMGNIKRLFAPFAMPVKGEGQSEGATGQVYLAAEIIEDKPSGRRLAIKFVEVGSEDAQISSAYERAIVEYKVSVDLENKHIVPCLANGTFETTRINETTSETKIIRGVFLVYEFLEDPNLAEVLTGKVTDRQPPTALDKIDWARQLASAMIIPHIKGIFHRDLKPANLFISPQKETAAGWARSLVEIIDFGLAIDLDREVVDETCFQDLTQGLTIAGTPNFMAPELTTITLLRNLKVLNNEELKLAQQLAEIYSIGAVLYVMLTGEAPIFAKQMINPLSFAPRIKALKAQGVSGLEIYKGMIKATLPYLHELEELNIKDKQLFKIIKKVLNPDPFKRFQNCAELEKDLAAYLAAIESMPEMILEIESSPSEVAEKIGSALATPSMKKINETLVLEIGPVLDLRQGTTVASFADSDLKAIIADLEAVGGDLARLTGTVEEIDEE